MCTCSRCDARDNILIPDTTKVPAKLAGEVRVLACLNGDVYNAGHVDFLEQCRSRVGSDNVTLIVCVPSCEVSEKLTNYVPVFCWKERVAILDSCRYVDHIVSEETLASEDVFASLGIDRIFTGTDFSLDPTRVLGHITQDMCLEIPPVGGVTMSDLGHRIRNRGDTSKVDVSNAVAISRGSERPKEPPLSFPACDCDRCVASGVDDRLVPNCGSPLPPKKADEARAFISMTADCFHYGHVNILRRARQHMETNFKGKKLTFIVSVPLDQHTEFYKRRTMFCWKERVAVLKACKWVDMIKLNPYFHTQESLEKIDMDVIYSGSDYPPEMIARLFYNLCHLHVSFPYTKGVSTTEILAAMRNATTLEKTGQNESSMLECQKEGKASVSSAYRASPRSK